MGVVNLDPDKIIRAAGVVSLHRVRTRSRAAHSDDERARTRRVPSTMNSQSAALRATATIWLSRTPEPAEYAVRRRREPRGFGRCVLDGDPRLE